MNERRRFVTIRETGCTQTAGLEQIGQRNIEFHYNSEDQAGAARRMAEEIIQYLETSGADILPGHTMSWATSLIRFDPHGKRLRVSALELESGEFAIALDGLLAAWYEQMKVCEDSKSAYVPTQLSDMAVVSPGIIEGAAIGEAIRYPFRRNALGWQGCGWWFVERSYSGSFSDVETIHVGDLLTARPNIRKYLALEPGFIFCEQRQPSVWFDSRVAEQGPI